MIPLIVVGNKSDLPRDRWVVDSAEAKHAFDAHRLNTYTEGTDHFTVMGRLRSPRRQGVAPPLHTLCSNHSF